MTQSRLPFPDNGRVFCIGRNYTDHIREMGTPEDSLCVIFMKPLQSLVRPEEPVRLPRDRGAVHHEAELVVELAGGGRDIAEEAALTHVRRIGLGLDLTMRDVQSELRRKGQPWELAKAFEQSAPLALLQPPPEDLGLDAIEFGCRVNDELRQQGHTRDLLFPVPRLIAILSQTWHLAPGDLIFTGTPAGVGPVSPGDRITVSSPQLGSHTWYLT